MMDAPLYLHVDEGAQGSNVCYIDKPHLDLLRKFYHRSSLSIGTAETVHIYQDVLTRMAAEHSYTLHAVLRFTLMHDRYLYDPMGTKPSTAEAFHGYHAATLFSKKLAAPLEENDKDAMWGCAALLGASSFAEFDGASPQESWPLKTPDLDDLTWLKMSEGKRAVWELANPLREGSVFKAAIEIENNRDHNQGSKVPRHPELERLFPFVTRLYDFDTPQPEGMQKNPYRTAASIVEKLVPIECNHKTIIWFLSFIGHMDPEYRRLLEQKDPAAMILLAWWYSKMIPYGAWWVSRRAWFETQAICIYLDKILSVEDESRKLLDFPRSVCGLYDPRIRPLAPNDI